MNQGGKSVKKRGMQDHIPSFFPLRVILSPSVLKFKMIEVTAFQKVDVVTQVNSISIDQAEADTKSECSACIYKKTENL